MSSVEKKEGADLCTDAAPSAPSSTHFDEPSIQCLKKIDNTEAYKFLSLLSDEEEFTFQTFDDKKDRRDQGLTRVLHGTLDEHFPLLVKLNEKGAGIFVTVNETDLAGRSAKNIKKIRAVFVDLDGVSMAPVFQAPLEPHIIVGTSAGRYHVYWIIEDLDLEDFTPVQKALSRRFSADPSVHDLSRVMRLPGFYHCKQETPFPVGIFSSSCEQPYQAEYFLNCFSINTKNSSTSTVPKLKINQDQILEALNKRNMVIRPLPNHPGGWDIICPFAADHTTGDTGTAYFEAYTNGYKGPGFKCQHAHCTERRIEDLKKYLGIESDEEQWGEPIPLEQELLPVMPLEADMVPDALRSWIEDIAERMQVPLDFLAVPAIVILGSLIGRKIGIFPKAHDDWLVFPNLWGGVVGRSALLKSPSIAEVMKPLEELATKAILEHKASMDEFEQQLLWLDAQQSARKESFKKMARKMDQMTMPSLPPLKTPTTPPIKRYKTEDSTVEKIGEILLHNPQGILIHRDELSGWLKGLDKCQATPESNPFTTLKSIPLKFI